MADAQYIRCAAPHHEHLIDLSRDDWVQLDLPGYPVLAFQSLSCLAVWVQHHGQTGFREIPKVAHELVTP